MSTRIEKAKRLFQQGFSCSQAVFSTYAVEQGIAEETALKLSQVFGGGMSHMGLTCGAVTGALLVLSLHFGRSHVEDWEAKDLTYTLAQEFCRRFSELHGSINCTDLLGCSLKSSHGLEIATEKGLFQKYCNGFVEDACRLLEKLIKEGKKKKKISHKKSPK